MRSESPPPARWKILGQRPLVQTRIFDVTSVRYHHPTRSVEREFVVINAPDWVNVIAVTPDGHLVLVRQFRYGTDDFSLEIPGGVIDPGEDPVAAGVRELREETGFAGVSAKLIGSVRPNPAMQSNRCHFVLVEQAERRHELEWDSDEEIQVSTLPVDDVLALARSGGIDHALVLGALLFFEPHWRGRKRQ